MAYLNYLSGIGGSSFPVTIEQGTSNPPWFAPILTPDPNESDPAKRKLVLNGYSATAYGTTAGADFLEIFGFRDFGDGTFDYALERVTLRLDDGDDVLAIVDPGVLKDFGGTAGQIGQLTSVEVSLNSAAGYIFQSNIFAGMGDDKLIVYMPWQSVFKGGGNTPYADVVLSDSLTLEEVEFGDSIELQGSRANWDLEFRDGNGDGQVSLASILSEADYIATSNNNQISGIERLIFGDIIFDLVLYEQVPSDRVYGQDGYYLFAGQLAPALNFSLTDGEIWEAFRFNRTKLAGIEGVPTQRVVVNTGVAADTPFVAGSVRYAELNTQGGGDIVEISGALEFALVNAGAGADLVRIGSINQATVIAGAAEETDNDTVEVKGALTRAVIRAGGGTGDVLVLGGTFADGTFVNPVARDAAGELYYQLGDNRFYGFEEIQIRNPFTPGTEPPSDGDGDGGGDGDGDGGTGGGGGGLIPDLDLDAFFQSTTDGIKAIRERIQTRLDEANTFNPIFKPGVITPDPAQFGIQFLVGTETDDIIEGGLGNEIIRGRAGRDLLLGGFGVDRFEFDYRDGLLSGDLILDFDQDKIALTNIPQSLTLGRKGKPAKTFARVKTLRKAERSKALVIYQQTTGELFFNANRNQPGFGDNGGLIARLESGLPLTAFDVSISTVPDFPGL